MRCFPRHVFSAIGFAILAFGCVLASCAAPNDLSAIQQYASITAQSGSSFSALASDYAGSCERYRLLKLGIVEVEPSSVESAALITHDPSIDAFIIPNASPQPGYILPSTPDASLSSAGAFYSDQSADECAKARQISVAWQNANSVALNYVQALGNLAGVDAVPTVNPSPFVQGLESAGVSSTATSDINSLITSIGNYFYQERRDREITTFLSDVNPKLPTAITALEQVDAYYSTRLDNEYRRTINDYNVYAALAYQTPLRRNGRTVSRQEVEAHLLRVKSAVQSALASTNVRLRACADYGAAMEAILATHQQLYAASQRGASLADYLKIVQTTGEPVVTNLVDLAKAVK